MQLPELPKKINRRESEIQHRVALKLMDRHPHRNWLLEVKTYKGKQKPHQKAVQKKVENGKFLHKFKDMGNEQPGDYVFMGDGDYILCSETDIKNNIVCEVNGGTMTYRFRI